MKPLGIITRHLTILFLAVLIIIPSTLSLVINPFKPVIVTPKMVLYEVDSPFIVYNYFNFSEVYDKPVTSRLPLSLYADEASEYFGLQYDLVYEDFSSDRPIHVFRKDGSYVKTISLQDILKDVNTSESWSLYRFIGFSSGGAQLVLVDEVTYLDDILIVDVEDLSVRRVLVEPRIKHEGYILPSSGNYVVGIGLQSIRTAPSGVYILTVIDLSTGELVWEELSNEEVVDYAWAVASYIGDGVVHILLSIYSINEGVSNLYYYTYDPDQKQFERRWLVSTSDWVIQAIDFNLLTKEIYGVAKASDKRAYYVLKMSLDDGSIMWNRSLDMQDLINIHVTAFDSFAITSYKWRGGGSNIALTLITSDGEILSGLGLSSLFQFFQSSRISNDSLVLDTRIIRVRGDVGGFRIYTDIESRQKVIGFDVSQYIYINDIRFRLPYLATRGVNQFVVSSGEYSLKVRLHLLAHLYSEHIEARDNLDALYDLLPLETLITLNDSIVVEPMKLVKAFNLTGDYLENLFTVITIENGADEIYVMIEGGEIEGVDVSSPKWLRISPEMKINFIVPVGTFTLKISVGPDPDTGAVYTREFNLSPGDRPTVIVEDIVGPQGDDGDEEVGEGVNGVGAGDETGDADDEEVETPKDEEPEPAGEGGDWFFTAIVVAIVAVAALAAAFFLRRR